MLLLRQAGAKGDTDLLAHTLLAAADTALVHHLTVERGMPLDRVEAGWHELLDRLARPS